MGAKPEDVLRTVIYVCSEETEVLWTAWRRLTDSPLAPALSAASTLLGISQLAFPGQLVEVDLTVALPD